MFNDLIILSFSGISPIKFIIYYISNLVALELIANASIPPAEEPITLLTYKNYLSK